MKHKEGARRVVSVFAAFLLATMGLTAVATAGPLSAMADETADVQADGGIVITYDETMVLHCPQCNGMPHVSEGGNQGITGPKTEVLFGSYVQLSEEVENTNTNVATAWVGEYDGKSTVFYQVCGVGTTDITVHTADGAQSATFRVVVTDVSDDPTALAEFDHCQTVTGVEIVWPADPVTIDIASDDPTWISLSTPATGDEFGSVESYWEFSSSSDSVAYVDEDDNVIVPVSVGTATITVTLTDLAHPEVGTFTDSITVNVIDSGATTPEDPEQGGQEAETPQQGVIVVSSGSDVLSGAATVNASDEAWAAFTEKAGEGAELSVTNAKLSDTQAAAIEKAERVALATWDVSMLDTNDQPIQVTSEDGLTLTVRLELSDEYAAYADDAFVVYYVGDDGTLEAKSTWVEEVEGVRFVCFQTTHLSDYVLTVSGEAAEQVQPLNTADKASDKADGGLAQTGDVAGIAAVGAVLCAAGVVAFARKRMQH